MGLFGKGKADEQGGDREAISSIIGKEMKIIGDIVFRGKMRLDGRAEGNVKGEYFILGATGSVVGDIAADVLVCSGNVEGNITVKKLLVNKGGTINGKVETSDLAVESGAMLNGEVKSRNKDIRLVPGSSIPEEEWEAKVRAASRPPRVS